jgi:hypothetical protein
MILGLTIPQFTLLHVVISLVGIGTGFIVMYGITAGQRLPRWTAWFLAFTVLTSLTGFLFPLKQIGPPHLFGVISLVVLAFALYGLYGAKLAGSWRWIYVVGAVIAQYLNVFVLIAQAFNKIPALNQFAPTQTTEPAFAVSQLVLLAIYVWVGILGVKAFRPAGGTLAFA